MQKGPTFLPPVHPDITYSALMDRNFRVPPEPQEAPMEAWYPQTLCPWTWLESKSGIWQRHPERMMALGIGNLLSRGVGGVGAVSDCPELQISRRRQACGRNPSVTVSPQALSEHRLDQLSRPARPASLNISLNFDNFPEEKENPIQEDKS